MHDTLSRRCALAVALTVSSAVWLAPAPFAQAARVPRVVGSLNSGSDGLIVLPSGSVKEPTRVRRGEPGGTIG